MTNRVYLPNTRFWDKNNDAVDWLLREITKGKTEKEAKKIKSDFYNTHLYLFLCEIGAMAPEKEVLLKMYKREQEEELFGFLSVLFEICPDYMSEDE